MAQLTLGQLKVFCIPLAPEVFEYLNLHFRASRGDLKQVFPEEAALQAALDALVDKGWLLHIDAQPDTPEFRDFSMYVITAPGLQMGRLLGLARPRVRPAVARFVRRLWQRFRPAA